MLAGTIRQVTHSYESRDDYAFSPLCIYLQTEHSHMLKNEILTSYGSEGTTCRSESAPNRDMSHWLPIELTRRYLSRCQNTKITILVLSCIIGFIDETLMTIPGKKALRITYFNV